MTKRRLNAMYNTINGNPYLVLGCLTKEIKRVELNIQYSVAKTDQIHIGKSSK